MKRLIYILLVPLLIIGSCKKEEPDPEPKDIVTATDTTEFYVDGVKHTPTVFELWYYEDWQTLTNYDRIDVYLAYEDDSLNLTQLRFQLDDTSGAVLRDTNTYAMETNNGNYSDYREGDSLFYSGLRGQTRITISKFDDINKKASGTFEGVYADIVVNESVTITGTFENILIRDF